MFPLCAHRSHCGTGNLVLDHLGDSPCSRSQKVAFLVVFNSVQVPELATLSCKSTCLVPRKDKAVLSLHPLFLPKVVSAFYLNEDILSFLVPSAVSPYRGCTALVGCDSGTPCVPVGHGSLFGGRIHFL